MAQWPFYGSDCSSDLLLPQLQYSMADVPVVQVVLFSWFRRSGDCQISQLLVMGLG